MDMQVDAQLIRNERLKRAWSQEQLAQVSGLGIRTVQRVEGGGNASLETIKSLSAVLELPVETLLADTPLSPSRPSLFKPWRAFATGCVTTLITMGGFVTMQGAFAEAIALDFAFSMNEEAVTKSRVSGEAGEEAIVQIGDGMSLHFTPSITAEGHVLIKARIYTDGGSTMIAAPSITTLDGQPAVLKVGKEDENGHFTGINLEITPTIE
jgi:transcriptional regulator with XRE-family HTH domain